MCWSSSGYPGERDRLADRESSIMRGRVRKDRLVVCIIAENHLAAGYLRGKLMRDRGIRPVVFEDPNAKLSLQDRKVVFVLDNCGLGVPLSQTLRSLRFQYPGAKFIILDKQRDEGDIHRLLWFGIHGFLTHAEVKRHLLPAVRSVSEGRMWVPTELLHTHTIHTHAARNANQRRSLTQREEQVIELVKRRFSNREIGEILGIRESTVKFHVSHVFSKVQASNRRDLANGRETLHKWAALLAP